MAFDSVPDDGDPRGPICPKCGSPVLKDQPSTIMHFDHDPKGVSGRRWHGECARPYWDKLTPLIDRLNDMWGRS